MKTLVFALALFAPCAAFAQAPAAPAGAGCISQYEDVTNASAASLVASAGTPSAASVPGGLWLQPGMELTYCTRAREGEVLCWLREPLKGQACS